jgi:hypothetical protein
VGKRKRADVYHSHFRKSITVPLLYCTLNEMKTRFNDLHARTALGLQLVPSIINSSEGGRVGIFKCDNRKEKYLGNVTI